MTKDTKNYTILIIEDKPGDFVVIKDYIEKPLSVERIASLISNQKLLPLFSYKEI